MTNSNGTPVGNSPPTNNVSNGGAIVNLGTLTVTNSAFSGNAAVKGGGIVNAVTGTFSVNHSVLQGSRATGSGAIVNLGGSATITSNTLPASGGNSNSLAGGLFVIPFATVIPQSISLSFSGSVPASASSGADPFSPGEPPASTLAPRAETGAAPARPGAPSADIAELLADIGAAIVDTPRTMPAPSALAAAIVSLDSAPGTGNARLIPLRESTLALVGTVLVVTLETAANDHPQHRSTLETGAALLVVPGVNPSPHRAAPWEDFVIGLDRDFDQIRRTFREPTRDELEPTKENREAPTSFNHLRATDEVLSTSWSEEGLAALAGFGLGAWGLGARRRREKGRGGGLRVFPNP